MKSAPATLVSPLCLIAPLALLLGACSGGGMIDSSMPPEQHDPASAEQTSTEQGKGVWACGQGLVPAESLCTLYNAKPALPLTIQLRESCGYNQPTRCEVTVSGNDIKLRLITETCGWSGGGGGGGRGAAGSLPYCEMKSYPCAIPALAEGRYNVIGAGWPVRGGSPGSSVENHLVVSAAGTQTTCALAADVDAYGKAPPRIDADTYDQACSTNADCTLVHDGDVCNAGCRGRAIATTDATKFTADFDSLESSCKRTGPQPPLDCPPTKAVCNAANKCVAQ
jgi:hypothetical protein